MHVRCIHAYLYTCIYSAIANAKVVPQQLYGKAEYMYIVS